MNEARTSGEHGPTRGVRILRGDPRRAIRRLAAPTVLATAAYTLYNLVDAFWVARLGADALAAVGLFFPFFFTAMAIATGIGIGGSSAVSRFVGAGDREAADDVATHTIALMVVAAIAFTVPLTLLARPLFSLLGAGRALEPTVGYARIMFGGTILVFFAHVGLALLRGEGDARRPMVAMIVGAAVNIVLDPIFIFDSFGPAPGLGLGVRGAAWASLASFALTSAMLLKWLFRSRETFVSIRLRVFRARREPLADILRVGVPAALQRLAMALMMVLVNAMLVTVGGTDSVAVFTTGWRIVMVAVLPVLGLTTAVVAVCGAAWGMRDLERLEIGFRHAVGLGLATEVVMVGLLYLTAAPIAALFTAAPGASHLHGELVTFLRTIPLFLPAAPLGMCSSGLFQGIGRGFDALVVTLLRTLVLAVPLAYLIGVVLLATPHGLYLGIVLANLTGGVVGFSWAFATIRRTRRAMAGDR